MYQNQISSLMMVNEDEVLNSLLHSITSRLHLLWIQVFSLDFECGWTNLRVKFLMQIRSLELPTYEL